MAQIWQHSTGPSLPPLLGKIKYPLFFFSPFFFFPLPPPFFPHLHSRQIGRQAICLLSRRFVRASPPSPFFFFFPLTCPSKVTGIKIDPFPSAETKRSKILLLFSFPRSPPFPLAEDDRIVRFFFFFFPFLHLSFYMARRCGLVFSFLSVFLFWSRRWRATFLFFLSPTCMKDKCRGKLDQFPSSLTR